MLPLADLGMGSSREGENGKSLGKHNEGQTSMLRHEFNVKVTDKKKEGVVDKV